jgi:hypothetical protein
MSTFVHVNQSLQHTGMARIEKAGQLLAQASHTVLQTLRARIGAWRMARAQAREDDQLWRIALTDARVMADLSRAMTADASRDVRGYY